MVFVLNDVAACAAVAVGIAAGADDGDDDDDDRNDNKLAEVSRKIANSCPVLSFASLFGSSLSPLATQNTSPFL